MKTEEEYKAEVLQLMRDLYPTLKGEEKERAERLFPELKESEDEVAWLIKFIQEEIDCLRFDLRGYDDRTKLENLRRSLAWLERQGEKKEINLIEILKHYPKETELYSPLYGKLWLAEIDEECEIVTCYKHPLNEGCTRAILKQEDTVSFYSNGTTGLSDFSISKDCMLFLYNTKKHSENKPTDKVEPKFKIEKDKWYICIRDLDDRYGTRAFSKGSTYYSTKDETLMPDNSNVPFKINCVNDYFRLWTIQDAKVGDVLATLDYILIFEKLLSKDGGVSYCHYDFGCSTPQFDFNKDDNWYFGKEAKVYPATKEQRELLFQKMHEAGYEWDAEKKELKKIEQRSAEISNVCEFSIKTWIKIVDYVLTEHKGIGNYLTNPEVKDIAEKLQKKYKFDAASEEWDRVYRKGLDAGVNKGRAEALREQKPAWSEEDEAALGDTLWAIKQARTIAKDENDMGNLWYAERWIKSIKERVQPQPQREWSEEDEKIREEIIAMFENAKKLHSELDEKFVKDAIAWLKKQGKQKKLYKIDISEKRKQELQEENLNHHPELLQGQKQGWSERLSKIVGYLRHKGYEDDADWIESFSPRPHWKPSDEQLEVLDEVIRNPHLSTAEYNGLIALREQFKEL